MKTKLLIVLFLSLTILSCKDKQEIIKDNITTVLKEKMNNPDSFQFVSMKIKKTITVGERKKIMTSEKLKEVYDLMGESELYNQYKTEFEFLQKQNEDNKEAVYYVDFIARGENGFGAIIKNEYSATVLNDENLTVVHFK